MPPLSLVNRLRQPWNQHRLHRHHPYHEERQHLGRHLVLAEAVDVGHGEALDELDLLLAVDAGLEHVGHVEEAAVLPGVHNVDFFVDPNG